MQVSIGPLATNEALAMDGYVRDTKVPLITTTSAATVDLKARQPHPYVLHAFGTAPQVTYPLGDYAAKEARASRRSRSSRKTSPTATRAPAASNSASKAPAARSCRSCGRRSTRRNMASIWRRSSRTSTRSTPALPARNPLRFLKPFAEFGLKGKMAVLGNTTMTDEGILKVMGEEAVGVYTGGWYAAGLDTPDNKKFVAGINAAYKHDPGFYTAGPYTALLIIEEALKTTEGKTDDAAAFLKAMHDVRLTHGPIGPVRLDEYGTPILDIYIRKVARVNGKLTNTIIKTYPQVSQFWTTDPKKAVEQPIFSRDFPPSKYLE